MQTTETTAAQWEKVMGDRPSFFSGCGGDCPVEKVNWYEVKEFIGRLNDLEGVSTYRLPTEAEWEYACRAGTTTTTYATPQGTTADDAALALDRIAWHADNSCVDYPGGEDCFGLTGNDTCTSCGPNPVARKQPNQWGLYDMLGNVWEWCQDWYGPYPRKAVTDPKGPSSGTIRVFRGCSWISDPKLCRSAKRDGFSPGGRGLNIGFRLVRSVDK
jgi:formylglycine-generating enzyme required for sulfatase activity